MGGADKALAAPKILRVLVKLPIGKVGPRDATKTSAGPCSRHSNPGRQAAAFVASSAATNRL